MADERKIRLRLGGKKRLEGRLPKQLSASQRESRKAKLEVLASLLRSLPKDQAGERMLRKLLKATDPAEALKLEKAIRRYVSEPATAAEAEPTSSVTFREFGLLWASNGLHEQFPRYVRKLGTESVRVNTAYVLYLSKTIGDVPLVRFTAADAKRALASVPATAVASATVRHYAQVIQTVIRKAMHPAEIIPADKYPLPVVGFLPKIDAPPSYPILYPADVAALLRCLSIPVWRRMLYGFAIFEGMRLSHMLRLRYSNVDFANGMLTIGIGKNNRNARTWELNTGVVKALEWYRGDAPAEDYIFPRLTQNEVLKLASDLRNDLVLAGVTREVRPDLFASGDGQQPIRFQDLRATFVSLHLAMGWSEVDVMLRTQHTSTKVLHHHYARRLGVAKAIVKRQGPLMPLFKALGAGKGGAKGGVNNLELS